MNGETGHLIDIDFMKLFMTISDNRNKIRTLFLAFLFVFIYVGLQAQKKISVTAKGSYEARDLTPEEVKQKAIDEAKRNAIVEAGISENVTYTDFLYTFEDNEKFKDIFQSFVSTETGAEIVVEEVKETKRDFNEFGNILIEVEIKATIYKHKKESDPSFKFKVEGIKEFYYENDGVSFSFKPSMDGYLRIFNVTDDTAFALYPYLAFEEKIYNDTEGRKFLKNDKVEFPVNSNIEEYSFSIDNPAKDKEYNLLIFIYTKVEIPFYEKADVMNIMKWMYEIPPDQKHVEQFGIIVNK